MSGFYEEQNWVERKKERRAKKAYNRDYTIKLLQRLGQPFDLIQTGGIIRMTHKGESIYLRPGTGSWTVRREGEKTTEVRGRGVNNLLYYMATGKIVSRENPPANSTEEML